MKCWELKNNDGSSSVSVTIAELLDTPGGAKPELDLLGGLDIVLLEPGDSVQFCAEFHNEPELNRNLKPFADAAGIAVGKNGLSLLPVLATPQDPPAEVVEDAPEDPFDPDVPPPEPHEGF